MNQQKIVVKKHLIYLISKEKYNVAAIEILAMVYLCQNKKEGIELANKVLKYRNTLAENINNPLFKQKWETSYNNFCEVNKTGIDIEFQCIINQNKSLNCTERYLNINNRSVLNGEKNERKKYAWKSIQKSKRGKRV